MPVLKETEHSLKNVRKRWGNPDMRESLSAQEKEAMRSMEEFGKRALEMHEVALKQYAPVAKRMRELVLDIKVPKFDFLPQLENLVDAMTSPHIQSSLQAAQKMAEAITKVDPIPFPFESGGKSVNHIAEGAHLEVHAFHPQVVIDPPVKVVESETQVVRIANKEEVAQMLLEELFKKYENRLPAIQGQSARDQLIEFVAGHLRILDYTIVFKGKQRSAVIKFFYRRRDRVSWFNYDSMQEIRDSVGNVSNTSIRETIAYINRRVRKETNGDIPELIESRQAGDKHNSPKEYRWAP
jgi:hypothetical protein